MSPTNIPSALDALDEYWSQRVLGKANGTLLKVAKGIGETTWHAHDDQDEVFIVYAGRLTIDFRDGHVELGPGDLFVVPQGVEHRPRAEEPVSFVILGRSVTSTPEGGKPSWSAPPSSSDPT